MTGRPDEMVHTASWDPDDRWAFFCGKAEYGARAWLTRARGDLTIEDLADRSELDREYLTELEEGKRMPQMRTVLKISVAYDVSPLWLAERFLAEAAR